MWPYGVTHGHDGVSRVSVGLHVNLMGSHVDIMGSHVAL